MRNGTESLTRPGWLAASVLAPGLVLLAALALHPGVDYNRWDNFEYFTPIIAQAQRQFLAFQVPCWNPHQHMGEPILAAGQPGVFYVPYALCFALARFFGSGDGQLALAVVATHAPFASLGWFLLLSRLGVRPLLALVAATSASCGGFFTVMASIWIFTVPIAAWLPWLLAGILSTISKPEQLRGQALIVLGLFATATVGHPQMLVYTWIFAGLVALTHATWVERQPARLARLALPCLVAALLSAVSMLPVWALVPHSTRAASMTMEEFLARSVAPETLMDLLLPVYRTYNGFLAMKASVALYQGAWIVPALAIALLRASGRSRDGACGAPGPDAQADRLVRCAQASGTVAILCLWLAMGSHGGLYSLTYGLPVWSSFRMPFKFLTFANAALILAGGCALEYLARRPSTRRRGEWAFLACLLALVLAMLWRRPSPLLDTPAGWIGLWTALLGAALVPSVGDRRIRCGLTALVLTGAVAVVVLSHEVGMKTYPDAYGAGAAIARVTRRGYRVLPLGQTIPWAPDPGTQELGLYDAATSCGFDSVTGVTAGLVLTWYSRWLPSESTGVIPFGKLEPLLGTNLLRSFNVRYLLARRDHAPSLRAMEGNVAYRRVADLEHVIVYEDLAALPRAYFADNVFRYTEEALRQGMIAGHSPLRSAFVEGIGHEGPCPPGRVLRADWQPESVVLDVDAPQGGFLVVSMTFHPDWRASIDGVEAEPRQVNGAIQGLFVPAGARQVRLDFRCEAVRVGLALALVGLAIGVIAVQVHGRRVHV